MADLNVEILQKVSQIDVLIEQQQRQEALLAKLSDAVAKLAVIEDRQNNYRADLQKLAEAQRNDMHRMEGFISKLDGKISALATRLVEVEKSDVLQRKVSDWVFSAVWAVAAAAAMFVAAKVGLV